MKVVLFCGGLGLRLRDYSDNIPKPMATIGYRPILWHVMKYLRPLRASGLYSLSRLSRRSNKAIFLEL